VFGPSVAFADDFMIRNCHTYSCIPLLQIIRLPGVGAAQSYHDKSGINFFLKTKSGIIFNQKDSTIA